jgi:hypothetical protein
MAFIDDQGWLNDGRICFSITHQPQAWVEWLEQQRPFHIMSRTVEGHLQSVLTVRPKSDPQGQASWYGYAYVVDAQHSLCLGRVPELTLNVLHWATIVLDEP